MRTETPSSGWQLWIGATASYLLIIFILCSGNQMVGFPVHHDDFTTLGADLGWYWLWPRPVFFAVSVALGTAGISVLYVSLHLFVIAYATLSLLLLRKLLDAPHLPLFYSVFLAAATLSFERTVEYSKYAGLLTNLLSGTLGVAAMYLMVSSFAEDSNRSRLRWWRFIGAWGLAVLSFWSKEDFVLPTVVLALYLAWERVRQPRTRAAWWVVLAAGVLLLAGALVLYNHVVQSVYTQSGGGPYKPDFSLVSVCRTSAAYILATPVAIMATLLQASTLVWNAVTGSPVRWSRMLLYHALIALLVLPYACLPLHIAPYYSQNWIVWQIGGALLLLWRIGQRPSLRWVFVLAAVVCVYVGQPGRKDTVRWYLNTGQVNRNIVATLLARAKDLRPYRQIVVEGAPSHGPWFGNTGRFLARLGLDHQWIVRVPKEGEYYRQLTQLLGGSELGSIRTVATEAEPLPVGLPIVHLSLDGTGVVDLPSVSPDSSMADFSGPRIQGLYPATAVAGLEFSPQPGGHSAIAVTGSNYLPGATVLFNGQPLETTYGNATLLSAIVPKELTLHAAAVGVTIRNPDVRSSTRAWFQIAPASDGR
jgi:hypothetical protein